MNEYVISVHTAKDLGSEVFVRDFLRQWCRELEPQLRPELFDVGEPIRKSITGQGFEDAVSLWVHGSPSLMLARKSKPKFLVDVKWRREKGKDLRPFPWGLTVYLALSAGDDLAERLFRFLINQLDPAFGYVTTRDEERLKHQVSFKDRMGLVQKFMGLDIGTTLPGVYWKTFFGKSLVSRFSLSEGLSAVLPEKVGDGWLVTAFPDARSSGTEQARAAEALVLQQLGREHFFDKQEVDTSSLKSDAQTVAVVEAAIRAKREGTDNREH